MFATVRSNTNFEGESRARSPSPTDADFEGESRARSPSPTDADLEGESRARSPSPTDADLKGESRARSPSPTDADLEGESRARSPSPTDADLEGESRARSPSPTDADLEGESRARSPSPTDADLEGESRARSPSPTDADLEGESRARSPSPTDAMRARAECNRQRARSLRLRRAASGLGPGAGGFLPEEARHASAPLAPRPAPLVDPAERPACLECDRPIALSYLLDTFQHPVCDDCRDAEDEGAHSLMTRTEAKAAYLLEDCDLDVRGGGALPCVRRRNPHAPRGDMRLYLRAQVQRRALLVWGDAARLQAERERREAARARAAQRREARALRQLRLQARSSLFVGARAPHAHEFAPETYDARADAYSRACACGHTETYEKM